MATPSARKKIILEDNPNQSLERTAKDSKPQLTLRIQKYENWINDIQEPLKALSKILYEELGLSEKSTGKQLGLREIREIIIKSAEYLSKFGEDLNEKTEEIVALNKELQLCKEELDNGKILVGRRKMKKISIQEKWKQK